MDKFKIVDLSFYEIDEYGDVEISAEDVGGEDVSWFMTKEKVIELIEFLQKQLEK